MTHQYLPCVEAVSSRLIWRVVLATVAALTVAVPAKAQLPQTRLYSIYPCGGKSGTSLELTLTSGADLDEVNHLLFNHPGITAAAKTQDVGGHKEPIPNVFTVAIASDVPSGVYEMYAGGLFGLSNPRIFVVGSQDETRETEPNNDREKPNDLVLNRVINGTVNGATDVDVYRFQGKKGQRIVAACRAADIDSRLSAVLEIENVDGRRIAYARELVRRDPVVDAVLPADGTYFLKVHDFIYHGGVEYVYRLSVGSFPHIDYILPPAGVPGTTARYTLFGRNLPGGQAAGVTIDGRPLEKLEVEIALPKVMPNVPSQTTLRSDEAGFPAMSYVLKSPAGESNPVLIQSAGSPPVLEKEPNDTPEAAQQITAPGEFAGQFQAPGDTDYVTFQAKAGQVFYVDVFANRMGSLADPFLVLEQISRDKNGRETATRITSLDDDNNNIDPNVFDTRTDDPTYRFQAPADGTYRIQLRDRSFESHGDPRLVYRLSLRPEKPDFQLVVLPRLPVEGTVKGVSTWALGLRKGDNRDVQILVLRQDGFREPIEIWAEGLPKGVTCLGASIDRSVKTTDLIFTAAENAPEWSGLVHVFGKARLTDDKKMKAVAAADDVIQKATDSASKAEAVVAGAAEAAHKADELLALLKKAAAAAPNDSTVSKALADAKSATESTSTVLAVAKQSLAGVKKKLAEAQTAKQKIAAAAAPTEIVHEAIPGEIVWSATAPKMSAISRVGQSLALSVMKEPAPFEVTTDLSHIDANQSRQILIPLTLKKRNHFDADVTLTLVGLPDFANVDAPKKAIPIPKGKSEDVIRLFVKRQARIGTYTFYWKAQASVPYQRNPYAAERATAEQAEAAKLAGAAAEIAKKAVAERDKAAKSASERVAALNAAKTKLETAKRKLVEAEAAVKKMTEEAKTAQQSIAEAEVAVKAAEQIRQKADVLAKESEARLKTAAAAKAAADNKKAQADKVAASQSIKDFPSSTPIILTIKPAPVEVNVSVANGGSLKKGGRVEAKVSVRRQRGFKGAVTIALPLPAGVTGIKAAPVGIAADKKDAVMTIVADASAKPGELANLVVRAQMEYQGKAEVDAPIALKIVP